MHAISGCDSTSVFHGMGKMKWLNIIKGNEEYYNALGLLEESPQIENHLFDMIESMICEPYEFPNESNVNDVRYEKCWGEKFPKHSKILPTKNKLHQHAKHVNFQALVWKNALEANEEIRTTDKHGWAAWQMELIKFIGWTIKLSLTRF